MKYEVIKPWHGVKLGDVVELKELHPSLKANVRPLVGKAAELVPAVSEESEEKPATKTAAKTATK